MFRGDIVRIDIPRPLSHGGRIPSGNEAGASEKWQPAGLLPTGVPEIVIDGTGMLPGPDYYAVRVEIGQPHGTS